MGKAKVKAAELPLETTVDTPGATTSRLFGFKSGKIYKMILRGELTQEELEIAFDCAFPDAMLDEDNDNHVAFMEAVNEARAAHQKADEERAKLELESGRDAARAHLVELGVDPGVLPEYVLDEIAVGLKQQDDNGAVETDAVSLDEELGAFVTESGVIVGWPSIEGDDRVSLLKEVGERFTLYRAKLEGIKAEKETRLNAIHAAYARQERRCKSVLQSLEWCYGPMGRQYVEEFIAAQLKTGKKKPVKSVFVGLLKLSMRTKAAVLNVVNSVLAADSLRALGLDDAYRTEITVLTSQIPSTKYADLDGEEGFDLTPAEEVFKLDIEKAKQPGTTEETEEA